MADGTKKPINELKVGDVVRGETRYNKVLKAPEIKKEAKLYGFNGGEKFVTEAHPFKTLDGWKAINPQETPKEGHDIEVTKLMVGDMIIREDGSHFEVKSIDATDDQDLTVYNPVLDGDNTYYADGYLVHNKGIECY